MSWCLSLAVTLLHWMGTLSVLPGGRPKQGFIHFRVFRYPRHREQIYPANYTSVKQPTTFYSDVTRCRVYTNDLLCARLSIKQRIMLREAQRHHSVDAAPKRQRVSRACETCRAKKTKVGSFRPLISRLPVLGRMVGSI